MIITCCLLKLPLLSLPQRLAYNIYKQTGSQRSARADSKSQQGVLSKCWRPVENPFARVAGWQPDVGIVVVAPPPLRDFGGATA